MHRIWFFSPNGMQPLPRQGVCKEYILIMRRFVGFIISLLIYLSVISCNKTPAPVEAPLPTSDPTRYFHKVKIDFVNVKYLDSTRLRNFSDGKLIGGGLEVFTSIETHSYQRVLFIDTLHSFGSQNIVSLLTASTPLGLKDELSGWTSDSIVLKDIPLQYNGDSASALIQGKKASSNVLFYKKTFHEYYQTTPPASGGHFEQNFQDGFTYYEFTDSTTIKFIFVR